MMIDTPYLMQPGEVLRDQTIALGPAGQIVMAAGCKLDSLSIRQHAEATAPAIVTNNAHHIRMRDIQITGGRPGVWAIQLDNPYEFVLDGIFLRTLGHGLLLQCTNDHPYNPGDGEIRSLHIRLQSPQSIGVRIAGQQPTLGGHYGGPTRYPANILWSHCYVTAGDRAGWASEGHIGIDILNTPKHTFTSVNLEELATCMRVAGLINGGVYSTTIVLLGGWLAGPFVIESGVSDVIAVGTRFDASPTGAGVARLARLGTDMGVGTAEPFLRVPTIRGPFGVKP